MSKARIINEPVSGTGPCASCLKDDLHLCIPVDGEGGAREVLKKLRWVAEIAPVCCPEDVEAQEKIIATLDEWIALLPEENNGD